MDCLSELETVVVSRVDLFLDYFNLTSKKYGIFDGSGNQMLIAVQDNSFASLFLPNSFVTFVIMNTDIRQVMILDRPRKMFKVSNMNVFAPSTRHIGSIRNKAFSLLRRSFRVLDATKKVVYNIRGPLFTEKVKVHYSIYNDTGERVGTIARNFLQFPQGLVFNANLYLLTFPKDIPVAEKSLLVGVTFYLVRHMYLFL